ncbi:MAG: PLP-dependent aminotransferase family protein [Vicinamibacteria bacterium]
MRKAPPGILPVIAVDRAAARPLHRQIYEGYRDAIVERRLRAGQRLPSTRALARELSVSRVPVVSAFEQLSAEGYIESAVGSGTFVAHALPDEEPPRTAAGAVKARPGPRAVAKGPAAVVRDTQEPWLGGSGAFRMSEVATGRFPFAVWSSLVARHSRNPRRNLLGYGDAMGHRPLREALAAYLRTARAVRCEADQIMVVSGSQHALEIAARVLLDRGSAVCIEEPGYSGVQEVLDRADARVVPVRVDAEGLDVDAAAARCPSPRAVYVTPSHQYPLGVTMSAGRRLQLLDWARRTGAWVLEDDYDSEYRYESLPIAALQGLDRDARVVYFGTFSKVLFPALRVGYLVIPPDLVARFAAVRQAMDIMAPTLTQAVLADFLEEGHFGRHLRRMRQLYGARRDALVAAIRRELGEALQVQGDQAGVHLVATLAKTADDRAIAERAARAGLWVMPLSSCYAGRAARRGFVLGYGGTEAEEMPDAVRRLRRVLSDTIRP